MIYVDLILNLTLLIALSIVSGFVEKRWHRQTRLGQLLQGALFGGAAVIGMLRPLNMGTGVIFDGRSVMVSLCALYFGPWATLVAGVMTILCRIDLGGAGTVMGVLVILSSSGIGLLAHFHLKPATQPPSAAHLYLFGFVVHVAMLALAFTLPGGAGLSIIMRIGLPVLLLFPLATILAGKLLSDQVVAERVMETLRKSEELLRETQQMVKVGGWEWDIGAQTMIWTEETYRIHDFAPGELPPGSPEHINRSLVCFDPEDRPVIEGAFRRCVEQGETYDLELPFTSKNGRRMWIRTMARPVIEKDRIVKVVGNLIDVSERKQAEEAEREQEKRFREVFENISTGIAIYAVTDNGEDLIFKDINPAGAISGRMKREDHIGKSVLEVYPGVRDLGLFKVFQEVWRTGVPSQLSISHYQDDRIAIWVENYVCRLPSGDVMAVYEDLTGRKQAEAEREALQAQLIQAQKMESVGRLAGGVAHDYNNMLSVIIGYAELALEKVGAGDPLHTDLEEILKAAGRSTDITRQLLAFARKQTIAPKVLDLNETVESMLKMLRRLIGEDIDLVWLPKRRLWPVKIDPSQIEQILANLCVNARDAIGGVGTVTIETHMEAFDKAYCADHAGFIPGEFVLLAASDDGSGMEKETLDNIFEPFFTTKDVNQGTGLGLATVYGIVKQNNGFINVSSNPGKGTTFNIYLPRHVGEVEEISADIAKEMPKSRGEVVLLVEDEPAISKMGRLILERLGYQVLTAGTPTEAARLAGGHIGKIHLLITDLVMPEMNGRDLANQLQDLCPEMKTLFMSGYTANVIAHHGVLEEGVQFIQKPFSIRDLGVKVREVLGDE